MHDIVIRTKRLVLRPLGPAYLETTNAYALVPENTRFMCFLPNRNSEETLEFLQDAEREWAKEAPSFYEFAVLLEGVHIGAVSVYFEEDAGELGWIIHRNYWKKGYAYEAAKAVIEYFAGNGTTHFIAHCDTENTASRRLMEKLGMTRTGEYGGRRNRSARQDSREYQYELTFPTQDGKEEKPVIRAYQIRDIPELIRIWNEVVEEGAAFPQEEPLDPESGAAFFAAQSYTGAAEADGKVVGLYILHPNNVGRCGHICNASYAVSADARGRHIGEQLVMDSLRMGRELGFRILQFNAVVESNVHARHLYERLGFRQLGTIPGGFRMKDGHYENICPYYHEL